MPNCRDNQREDTLAYLAGLLDGEGTIRMVKMRMTPTYTKYLIGVSFVNTNKQVVDMMARFFQTKVYIHRGSKSGFQGRKDCYKMSVQATHKAIEPIKKLLPYLIIKKPQAELMIKFYVGKKDYRGKWTKTPFPPKETRWREKIYKKYLAIAHPQRLIEQTPKGEVIV